MTRTDRQEQRVPRETSQQKARRVIRKGRPKCEVDGAKDRKQELALTVALSTELDVRGKGWKQRAVLKCSPSLWPFETTALQTPIILKSPRFSSPLSSSLSILHLSPCTSPCPSPQLPVDSPVLPLPSVPERNRTPRKARDRPMAGTNSSAVWESTNLYPYPESDTPAQDREEPANKQTEGENLGCGEREIGPPDAAALCSHT